MGDSVIPVIFGGFFTILGVIIGWGLNEVSAIRRAKPKLCFKLNSTPDSELVEAELRTKTSASEYSIDIYNVGQSPVIIESFDMCWRKQLLIQCFPSSEDATVLPYHNISYVLTQQDADAIERHCKRLGFKQCCIVATTVNGEKFKENIEVDDYTCIKCNIGRDMYGETKIYHLPFDQQYDSTKISKKGEFYAMTVAEAEEAGFRRAFKWFGN